MLGRYREYLYIVVPGSKTDMDRSEHDLSPYYKPDYYPQTMPDIYVISR